MLEDVRDRAMRDVFVLRDYRAGKTVSWSARAESVAWDVFGPMLNLSCIGRHGTKIVGEIELGGMGHAFLARRFIDAREGGTKAFVDPAEIWVNGGRCIAAPGHPGGFVVVGARSAAALAAELALAALA